MANEILLTKEGHEKLKAELEQLKGPRRVLIAEAIREAKSHGDLKENAAYHEAKLNQSRIEGRIAELEKTLQMAKIVDKDDDNGTGAQLGALVKLFDLNFEEELMVKLVGSFEADPANDMISITAPLGASLRGKEIGDEFEVIAPSGKQRYRVLAID